MDTKNSKKNQNKSKKLKTIDKTGNTGKTKKIFQVNTNSAIENLKLIKKNNPNYQKCFFWRIY
jgi:hypothetical protein